MARKIQTIAIVDSLTLKREKKAMTTQRKQLDSSGKEGIDKYLMMVLRAGFAPTVWDC